MNLDPNALAAIRHNQTVLLDQSRIAEFRLPLPGLPSFGESSGLQLVEAVMALGDLATACRVQKAFLQKLVEAVREKGAGSELEMAVKAHRLEPREAEE